jgi:hypothetical protein
MALIFFFSISLFSFSSFSFFGHLFLLVDRILASWHNKVIIVFIDTTPRPKIVLGTQQTFNKYMGE